MNPYIVECPVCGASPGEVCHTPLGYVMAGVHAERKKRSWYEDRNHATPPQYGDHQ